MADLSITDPSVITYIVMVLFFALICFICWYFLHKEKGEDRAWIEKRHDMDLQGEVVKQKLQMQKADYLIKKHQELTKGQKTEIELDDDGQLVKPTNY